MSKVLLISPRDNFTLDNDIFPRLGLVLFSTLLRKKGHDVRIVHMIADKILTEDQVKDLLKSYKPDIVGITLITYQTRWAKIVSRLVKEYNKDILVVVGGPHPSSLRDKMFDTFPNIDIVVYGEGEESFIDIVEGRILNDIPGIIYKNGTQLIDTGPRRLYENLDSLPFPDWSAVNLKRFAGPYPSKKSPSISVMGSRGCPNSCTFCFKAVHGKQVRYHSPNYLIEQVQYAYDNYGSKEAYFQDDTFNLNRVWLESILDKLIKTGLSKKMVFRSGFRVDTKLVDLDLLKLMKAAGFWSIFFGVESGSQYMLDRMKKTITLDEIRRAFRLAHSIGLKTEAPFIIGLPGETEQTIKESIAFYKELRPTVVGFARAMPFPGTAFEKEVKERGHVLEADFDDFSYLTTRVRTDSLTSEQLEEWERYCNKLAVRNLMKRCFYDPRLFTRTVGAIGWKETISKVLRNIK